MIILDGKAVSKKKQELLRQKVSKLDKKLGLAIICVGNDTASLMYAKRKEKIAQFIGYYTFYYHFDDTALESEIIECIQQLNKDENIHGIIVELPLPNHINKDVILNSIDYHKDVDGLTSFHRERLIQHLPCMIPCTALGIIDLLNEYHISLLDKKIVIIGKSILVGFPLFHILKNNGANVVMLDSKTKDVSSFTKDASIIIVSVGKEKFLTGSMIQKGAIVIDVGINSTKQGVVGDVDVTSVRDKVSYLTPVPGGVGPMTLYEAMNNLYLLYQKDDNFFFF